MNDLGLQWTYQWFCSNLESPWDLQKISYEKSSTQWNSLTLTKLSGHTTFH